MRLALGERLAARHRVILVDRAGLGWSERRGRRGSSPAYQAAMLRDVLDRLGVARAIVVGHSWGGALAAAFALDHPQRVAGLVLLAPPLYPFPRRTTWLYELFATPVFGWLYAHTLGAAARLAVHRHRDGLGIPAATAAARLPQAHRRAALAAASDVSRQCARCRRSQMRSCGHKPSAMPRSRCRRSLITGDRDMVVPPQQHAIAFAAAVPTAKLVVLPGIGHMLHHVAADRVIAEIEALAARATGE